MKRKCRKPFIAGKLENEQSRSKAFVEAVASNYLADLVSAGNT